ncbi:MAG: DUF2683 family protein [archaeon]
MVKAIVEISEEANRILNIVKAKEDLRDKSDAINLVVSIYGEQILEPQLRPDFIKEILQTHKEKAIKVKHFSERYN